MHVLEYLPGRRTEKVIVLLLYSLTLYQQPHPLFYFTTWILHDVQDGDFIPCKIGYSFTRKFPRFSVLITMAVLVISYS